MKFPKLDFKITVGLMALAMLAMVGCSSKGGSKPKVVIIVHGGVYGYYDGGIFCNYYNNYCGTSLACGISGNGLYYNGVYWNNWTGTNNSGNGSGNGTGSNSGNASGNGSGNSSGNASGNSSGNGSGNSSGNGSGNSFALQNGKSCTEVMGCAVASDSFAVPAEFAAKKTAGNEFSQKGSSGYGSTVGGNTKDVDLQQAEMQKQDLNSRARSVAAQFHMDFESARQLSQLADKVQQLNNSGTMTAEDREAITNTALGVAGISSDEVNEAMAKVIRDGNKDSIEDLMSKAAKNLGMRDSQGLREQILPTLGINL